VRARVEEVLAFIGLGDCIDRMPSTVSGGQRRRVAIARAMAATPGLLLFDDPTTGLDPIIATTVDNEIVKLRDLQHMTSIVVPAEGGNSSAPVDGARSGYSSAGRPLPRRLIAETSESCVLLACCSCRIVGVAGFYRNTSNPQRARPRVSDDWISTA
jgi:ABC transporter